MLTESASVRLVSSPRRIYARLCGASVVPSAPECPHTERDFFRHDFHIPFAINLSIKVQNPVLELGLNKGLRVVPCPGSGPNKQPWSRGAATRACWVSRVRRATVARGEQHVWKIQRRWGRQLSRLVIGGAGATLRGCILGGAHGAGSDLLHQFRPFDRRQDCRPRDPGDFWSRRGRATCLDYPDIRWRAGGGQYHCGGIDDRWSR